MWPAPSMRLSLEPAMERCKNSEYFGGVRSFLRRYKDGNLDLSDPVDDVKAVAGKKIPEDGSSLHSIISSNAISFICESLFGEGDIDDIPDRSCLILSYPFQDRRQDGQFCACPDEDEALHEARVCEGEGHCDRAAHGVSGDEIPVRGPFVEKAVNGVAVLPDRIAPVARGSPVAGKIYAQNLHGPFETVVLKVPRLCSRLPRE